MGIENITARILQEAKDEAKKTQEAAAAQKAAMLEKAAQDAAAAEAKMAEKATEDAKVRDVKFYVLVIIVATAYKMMLSRLTIQPCLQGLIVSIEESFIQALKTNPRYNSYPEF